MTYDGEQEVLSQGRDITLLKLCKARARKFQILKRSLTPSRHTCAHCLVLFIRVDPTRDLHTCGAIIHDLTPPFISSYVYAVHDVTPSFMSSHVYAILTVSIYQFIFMLE